MGTVPSSSLGPPRLAVLSFIELYNHLDNKDKFYIHELVGMDTFHEEYEKLYHLHYNIDISFNEWLKIGNAEMNIESNRKFVRRWKQIKPLIKSIVYKDSCHCLCLTRDYQPDEAPISMEDVFNDTSNRNLMIEYKGDTYDIDDFLHGPVSGIGLPTSNWTFEDWYNTRDDESGDTSDDAGGDGENWREKYEREDEEKWIPFFDRISK